MWTSKQDVTHIDRIFKEWWGSGVGNSQCKIMLSETGQVIVGSLGIFVNIYFDGARESKIRRAHKLDRWPEQTSKRRAVDERIELLVQERT